VNKNLIIAGTEKAGTTALYLHLAKHPDVCASVVKETNFFRQNYTGELAKDGASYRRLFAGECKPGMVMLEASPGYLAEASDVAPRIAALLPDALLVFILREPAERLRSFFEHSRSQLKFSSDISYGQYVDACLAHEVHDAAVKPALSEWHLNGMRTGRYAELLIPFFEAFDRQRLLVVDYEALKTKSAEVTRRVCGFAGLNTAQIQEAQIEKANVTFSGRIEWVHRVAVHANRKLEFALRHRPALKRSLVTLYKKMNQQREGYDPTDTETQRKVREYYRGSNEALAKLLAPEFSMSWLQSGPGG